MQDWHTNRKGATLPAFLPEGLSQHILVAYPTLIGAMEHWQGLLCALCAALAFGVQYAPVAWG